MIAVSYLACVVRDRERHTLIQLPVPTLASAMVGVRRAPASLPSKMIRALALASTTGPDPAGSPSQGVTKGSLHPIRIGVSRGDTDGSDRVLVRYRFIIDNAGSAVHHRRHDVAHGRTLSCRIEMHRLPPY
jgi:hypothetical protein